MNNENTESEFEPTEDVTSANDVADSTQQSEDGTEGGDVAAETIDFAGNDDEVTIASLQEQLAEAEKRALLQQADSENFRRRKSREAQEQVKYASLPLINGLLDVMDNLNRALDSAADETEGSSLREGVKMVAAQLEAMLKNHGCVKIETVGQVFDPNLHEAIQMQPAEEPANTIVLEAQAGFKLHDRVVRPPKVIVSTGPA